MKLDKTVIQMTQVLLW